MDPVAHTLFGATLAETGLRRLTRYATPALIIGANLPDIDGVTMLWGRDTSLYLRRGWTHGVLAMVVLPALLAGTLWAWHRWRGGGAEEDEDTGRPLHPGWLLVLCYVSTWSHPLLDWMNTYGVRLLMPFDDSWFYGDTLFIIDPWFWLLTASGVVLARSGSRRAVVGWCVLGALASALVLATSMVPLWVKLGWVVGVIAIASMRLGAPGPDGSRVVSRAGLATLLVYIGVLYGLARTAERGAIERERPLEVQANPMPGVPFEHRVVVVYEDRYEVVPPHGARTIVEREEPDEVVRAALAADSIRGFANWTRFPYWSVEEKADGWVVTFRDLRYVDPGEEPRGIGFARVELDEDLREKR